MIGVRAACQDHALGVTRRRAAWLVLAAHRHQPSRVGVYVWMCLYSYSARKYVRLQHATRSITAAVRAIVRVAYKDVTLIRCQVKSATAANLRVFLCVSYS
jgi:hypothetical protein